jgi:hypothetical protein
MTELLQDVTLIESAIENEHLQGTNTSYYTTPSTGFKEEKSQPRLPGGLLSTHIFQYGGGRSDEIVTIGQAIDPRKTAQS